MPKIERFDEDGNSIPATPEEEAEAIDALKGAFNGTKEIVFSEEALEDLKRMGLTQDEIMAMMAKDLGVQN